MKDQILPPEMGPALFKRLQQNIIDNMPSGSHRARAVGWRKLARRCEAAADAHEKVADQRDETRLLVRSFAPAYRQAALDALAGGVDLHFNNVPAGYRVENAVPDMTPEDFRAFCDEQIQKVRDAEADARLLERADTIPAPPSDDLGDDPDEWYAAQLKLLSERGPA